MSLRHYMPPRTIGSLSARDIGTNVRVEHDGMTISGELMSVEHREFLGVVDTRLGVKRPSGGFMSLVAGSDVPLDEVGEGE